MNIYTLYIDDDRYRVPTLLSVEFADDEGVIAHMADILGQSTHYLGVEAWDGDRLVGRREK